MLCLCLVFIIGRAGQGFSGQLHSLESVAGPHISRTGQPSSVGSSNVWAAGEEASPTAVSFSPLCLGGVWRRPVSPGADVHPLRCEAALPPEPLQPGTHKHRYTRWTPQTRPGQHARTHAHTRTYVRKNAREWPCMHACRPAHELTHACKHGRKHTVHLVGRIWNCQACVFTDVVLILINY